MYRTYRVQVYWGDENIYYSRPTIETLKSDECLFDNLKRLVPCEYWGVVLYDSIPAGNGKCWYFRQIAEKPTTQNRWAAFDLEKAQASIALLELSVRHWPNMDVPTILIQDIRRFV